MLSDLKTLEVILDEPAVEVAMLWNSELDREPEHHDCKGVLTKGRRLDAAALSAENLANLADPNLRGWIA